jgi:hypothetical protein
MIVTATKKGKYNEVNELKDVQFQALQKEKEKKQRKKEENERMNESMNQCESF